MRTGKLPPPMSAPPLRCVGLAMTGTYYHECAVGPEGGIARRHHCHRGRAESLRVRRRACSSGGHGQDAFVLEPGKGQVVAAPDAGLLIQMLQVDLHRAWTDAELAGNLVVGEALLD